MLGKRNREGSASPPIGLESGQPEAKRSTKASSPVENGASLPVEVDGSPESDDEVGPMPGGAESDDEVGPVPGGGADQPRRKKKKTGEYSAQSLNTTASLA
jgi:hypothetical protein